MSLRVPTTFSPKSIADWVWKAANTINQLAASTVLKDGAVTYAAPIISNPPTQAEVQAIADALEAVSDRLKG